MKLKALHIFVILLLSLILSCSLGNCVYEGMANQQDNVSNQSNQGSQGNQGNQGSQGGQGSQGSQGNQGGPAPIDVSSSNQYSNPTYNDVSYNTSSSSQVVVTNSGQQVVATPNNTVYGISASEIPAGQSDLYILKSEIVPPVCPVCPTTCNKEDPPPCPPCARCPEPAFDCKKVPNYSSTNYEYLPRPVLNDFSQFGM